MTHLLLAALLLSQTPGDSTKRGPLLWIDSAGRSQRITDQRDWPKRRVQILASMQKVMGPLPKADESPLDVRDEGEESLEKVVRKKITFVAEKGDRVPAYLLIPKGPSRKRPAMLCLHQTSTFGKKEPVGAGGWKNLHYGLELAERGYVTLSPDYPNFGDYKFDPYTNGYVSATMKGIVNHRRAVDFLQSLSEVDPERIGVIGHSLGGHNALFVAAFDERLKVAVTSCGFNSFAKYYGGDLTGWSHRGYMPRIDSEYGKDPKRMPFDFPEVLAAIAPRAVFVSAPLHDANFEVSGVRDCLQAAETVYKLLGSESRLAAIHPDCQHDFPPAIRKQAYEFIDRVLAPLH